MMPMEALLNALMAIGLLLVLILIIYLIDRVNSIETETRKVVSTLHENAARVATPSMGLSGKKLWDAMTGRSTEGLEPSALEELRGRYPVILSKHAEALYKDGFKDGVMGLMNEAKNLKTISMSKGTVDSWIPSAQANALYQCGLNASQTPEAQWGPLRASMDEAGQFLWSKAQLDASSPLSEWLMPSSSEGAAAPDPTVNKTAEGA
jgi:hypothetical protein